MENRAEAKPTIAMHCLFTASPDADKREVPATQVEACERKHHRLDYPVSAMIAEMPQGGLPIKDLVPMIGKPCRVYGISNHKRPLTLTMMWKLHQGLGIPAQSLIKTSTLPR